MSVRRMWSLFVVASVAIAIAFMSLPASASPLLTEFAALKDLASRSVEYGRAISDSKPALVEFYADWCNICRAMAPTMAHLHETYGDRVNFVMLDIDDPSVQTQVEEFGVRGVPHYALIGELNRETGDHDSLTTLVGRYPDFVMENYVAQLLDS
ncbi:MAG: thioredoxin domain-containing protein [Cyanobacteria bacterium J06639_1]